MTGTAVAAASAMSLILNGTPIQASYLQSEDPPCLRSKQVAIQWRKQGHTVVESSVANWCTAGVVIGGNWVGEQWRASAAYGNNSLRSSSASGSEGWRVVIPLAAQTPQRGQAIGAAGIDIYDLDLATRIQVRRSSQDLASHHKNVLTSWPKERGRLDRVSATSNSRLPSSLPPQNGHYLISRIGQHGLVLTSNEDGVGSYSVVITRSSRHE